MHLSKSIPTLPERKVARRDCPSHTQADPPLLHIFQERGYDHEGIAFVRGAVGTFVAMRKRGFVGLEKGNQRGVCHVLKSTAFAQGGVIGTYATLKQARQAAKARFDKSVDDPAKHQQMRGVRQRNDQWMQE
jgi:hypothetical protein